MKITLDYRNPTQSHCDVAVFVNGALAGQLTLRQTEVGGFDQIIHHGAAKCLDTIVSRGPTLPSSGATYVGLEARP